MLKNFNDLEKQTNKVQKQLIELQDENSELRFQISDQNVYVKDLQTEIDSLRAEIARLNQVRLEHIQDLDQAVSYLTKRRRLVAYALDSPLSPTYEPSDQQVGTSDQA